MNKEKIETLKKCRKFLLAVNTIYPEFRKENNNKKISNTKEKQKVKVLTKKYYGKDLVV